MDNIEFITKVVTDLENGKKVDLGDIEKVSSLREEAAELYYKSDRITIPNELYDRLTRAMRNNNIKVNIDVANSVKEITTEHTFENLAGSLEDEVSPEVIANWIKTNGQNGKALIKSYKGDGNSVTLEFDATTGKLNTAVTRGRDGKGVDLTSVFSDVKIDIKELHATSGIFGIKFEAILTYANFRLYCTDNNKELANPRSAISGILGKNDAHLYGKYISLCPIEIRHTEKDIKRMDQIQIMEKICKSSKKFVSLGHELIMFQDFEGIVASTLEKREKMDFMIDGLVLEFTDDTVRDSLGYASGYPKFAKAFKFPYAEYVTEVERIEFDFGSATGRFTPCAIIKPVKHNGATYTRVSIANYRRFEEMKLGRGSKVMFTYNMDCMGYIEVLDEEANKKVTPFKFIDTCPYCNTSLVVNANRTFIYCKNDSCEAIKKGHIENFVKKLTIKEFKMATIDKLYDAKLITNIPSLFTIDYSKVEELPGLGKRSADKIKNEINKKSTLKDYEALGAFPIENLGLSTSLGVCKVFPLEDLLAMSRNDIFKSLMTAEIPDVAAVMSNIIADGIDKYRDDLKLMYKVCKVVPTVVKSNTSTILSIAVTGTILYPGARNGLKKFIQEELGQKFSGSVSKNTDYLICNNSNDSSDKLSSAKEHGVKIISEDEFLQLVKDKKI